MKVVAGDVGKFEREAWVPSVVIAPAERYVVDVEFAHVGRVALVNRVQALDHMFGTYLAGGRHARRRRGVGDGAAAPTVRAQFATLRRNARRRRRASRRSGGSSTQARRSRARAHAADARVCPPPSRTCCIGINAAVEWNDGMPMMNWLATGKEVTLGPSRSGDGQGEHGHRLALSRRATS